MSEDNGNGQDLTNDPNAGQPDFQIVGGGAEATPGATTGSGDAGSSLVPPPPVQTTVPRQAIQQPASQQQQYAQQQYAQQQYAQQQYAQQQPYAQQYAQQPPYQQPSKPAAPKREKKSRHMLPAFLMGLLGVVLGLAIGAGIVYHVVGGNAKGSSATSTSTGSSGSSSLSGTTINVTGDDATIAEAVSAKDLDSVVTVDVTTESTDMFYGTTESEGLGSGVILSSDGYILTNYHVVENAKSISVAVGDTMYDATVTGSDPTSDLAVIKIDATGLTPIEIGSSSDLKVGEWVATIGSPFGLEKSVSVGVVSALYRSASMTTDTGYSIYANMIQTDASINPGNSGGALVDSEGKLVGISTLFSSYSGSSSNVGFAIPIDYAYRIAEQIMSGEQVTHAYLGVSLGTVDADNSQRYSLSTDAGAYVNDVYSGTAADKAGLKKGDIIVKADGTTITSADELIIAIRSKNEGDTMDLTYNRDGQENTVTVTLGSDAEADEES